MLIPVDYFITECAFDAAVYFCGDERTLELWNLQMDTFDI